MRSFRDNKDRQWNVALTVGALKRLKAEADVDLLLLDVGEPPLGARLNTDMALVCDVLWVLVRPQADQMTPPVDDVAFGEGLGPEGFAAGHAALSEEIADFFQKAGRPELSRMASAHRELVRLATAQVTARIEAVDLVALASKIGAASASNAGAPSTNSPPPPESKMPTPSPSASSPGEPSSANASPGTTPPT